MTHETGWSGAARSRPTAGGPVGLDGDLAPRPAREEQEQLWPWVRRLERMAEAGLHARGLAHDLGNVLTAVMAGCELALLEEDPGAWRAALARSLKHSRVASARLHAYVDFLRRRGEGDGAACLGEVIEDALHLIAHPLRKIAAKLDRQDAEEAWVLGSRAQLVQVVANTMLAVLGACEGTYPLLRIRTAVRGEEAVLEIHGTHGDPCSREGPWAAAGTGLELEVARRVVTETGGRFECRPGAREARVILPMRPATPADHAPATQTLRPTHAQAFTHHWV